MPPKARKDSRRGSRRTSDPAAAETSSPDAAPPADNDAGARWRRAAVVLLVLVAAAASLTLIWNFDVFWHLAAGKWMISHGAVLRHDPFSSEGAAWVNVHWLFQCLVAALHVVGGFAMLSVLKCLVAVATMFTLAWPLRKRVPPGWLIFSGAAMLAVMAERIRLRPELFTCAFVMLTVVLLEGVRLGARPRRLWWLVPIMLVWVNMHGLYFFGLGLMWSSYLGAWLDSKLRRPREGDDGELPANSLHTQQALGAMLAATVACLVSPWPIRAAAHPFLLWTRVSGQAIAYTYGVSELQPTWQALGKHWPAVVVAALSAAALASNRRRAPITHALWLAAFAFIGLLARRNVGLIAPVCGYVLAWHGAAAVRKLGARGGCWPRIGRTLTWLAAAAVLLLSAGYVTETVHRMQRSTERFGVGLLKQNYPIRTAEFLRKLDVDGEIYCENFGDAAVFIYYAADRRKVWMDGRLEVHSLQRFAEQTRIANELRTKPSATWARLPDGVRFIVVGHQSSEVLCSLMESHRYRLLFVDRMAACFTRTDYKPPPGRADRTDLERLRTNLDEHDRPLGRDLRVEQFPAERPRWYRRNPAPRTYWMGAMLFWLGRLDSSERGSTDPLQRRCTLLSARYLTAAQALGIVDRDVASGMLAWAHHQRSLQWPVEASDELPADMNLVRALHLYAGLDLGGLRTQTMRAFAYRHVHALVDARQFDAADKAVADLLRHLPPARRVNPPREYLTIRGVIAEKLSDAEARLSLGGLDGADRLRRARAMVAPEVGLIDAAIEELERVGRNENPAATVFLGDLYLRRGRPEQARLAYRRLLGDRSIRPAPPRIAMRLALCDWAAGELFKAAEALNKLALQGHAPSAYYAGVLGEHLGRYEQARKAAAAARTDEAKLVRLLVRLRRRLNRAGGREIHIEGR